MKFIHIIPKNHAIRADLIQEVYQNGKWIVFKTKDERIEFSFDDEQSTRSAFINIMSQLIPS